MKEFNEESEKREEIPAEDNEFAAESLTAEKKTQKLITNPLKKLASLFQMF